jgi:pimeloyl-ACP methyl ester carboxylesterase
MDANRHTVSAGNGREIRIIEAGQPDGLPVLVHHGTPGSSDLYHLWVEDAQARGIRLIGCDRPGYGGSTPHPNRTVASVADDVAAIAKAQDIAPDTAGNHPGVIYAPTWLA